MIDDRTSAVPQKTMSFNAYRNMKLRMLTRDFCIKLTEEELAHAKTLKTKVQVDQFCITALDKYWG